MSASGFLERLVAESRAMGLNTKLLEEKMPPREIHVIGIDPGVTTGWARLTVPRMAIYGDEPSKIISWETGTWRGRISDQVWTACEFARQTQSMTYKIGPALVVEDFDFGRPLADPEVYTPVYFAQQLMFCKQKTALLNDAQVFMQRRATAKATMTDERLQAIGVWESRGQQDHERDALRHALTALRRAKKSLKVRLAMWGEYALTA
jgi:hypothetical protein